MFQGYSDNLTVPANTVIPINNVKIQKGCNETLAAPGTVQLQKRGVYLVSVDGYGTAAAPGAVGIQLLQNGIPQTAAQSSATVPAANSIVSFGFKTSVQVSQDNTPCCCTSPTSIAVSTLDEEITGLHLNIVVTKLC